MPRSKEMRRSDTLNILFLLAFIAMFFQPAKARANTVIDLSIAEMSQQASIIVQGTVANVSTHWNDDQTRIFTEIDIDVTSYIAGQGPQTVHIRQVGGRVDDTELVVAGQPTFNTGENVLVFLEPDGSGQENYWVCVCMSAGKFTLSFDSSTGELVVSQNTRNLNRFSRQGQIVMRSQNVARPFLFRDLLSEINAALQGGEQ